MSGYVSGHVLHVYLHSITVWLISKIVCLACLFTSLFYESHYKGNVSGHVQQDYHNSITILFKCCL